MADYLGGLEALDGLDARSDYGAHRLYGVYTGLVTNNQDPENRGRVKVKLPWLHASEESWWARVATFYAGKGRGSYFMPEVDDEVLVVFERGDFHHPYVVGSLWNGVDNVPGPGNPDGENNVKHIELRSGHKLVFDDTAGAEKISLIDSSGNNSLVIDTAADTITMQAATGDIKIQAPPGSVNLSSKHLKVKVTHDATYKVTEHTGLTVGALHSLEVAQTQKWDVQGSAQVTVPIATVSATKLQFTAPNVRATIATGVMMSSTKTFEGEKGFRTSGAETATIGTWTIKANEGGLQAMGAYTTTVADFSGASKELTAAADGAATLTAGMVKADGSPGTVLVKGSLVTLS